MKCVMGDSNSNLERIAQLARVVQGKRPDLVCFPELATTGYSLGRRWRTFADPVPGRITDGLGRISAEGGFYVVCGVDELDAESDQIYDSAVLLSPSGKLEGVYRKVHLWDEERKFFAHGTDFPVFGTKLGKIGLGICYDIEFPESSRLMAMKGAKILCFPSAEMSPMEDHVQTYVKSRAMENCVYVAFSNRMGVEGKTNFFGLSQIVSPAAGVLVKAGKNQVAVADLDLSALRKIEVKLPYLKQRVPEAYSWPTL
jgi:5-aminopentanamidase